MGRKILDAPLGTLEERCAALAKAKLYEAAMLPLGAERARLEREAWELQNASRLNNFFSLDETKTVDG